MYMERQYRYNQSNNDVVVQTNGSVKVSHTETSQCRWGPVDAPEDPTVPSNVPLVTTSPASTKTE